MSARGSTPPRERLLGRHESRRADHRRFGIGAAVLRDAPVHHVDLAEAADHDVLRLQVAMHDAVRVREGDGIQDASEDRQPIGERQAIANQIVEAPPLHQLHHVERAAVIAARRHRERARCRDDRAWRGCALRAAAARAREPFRSATSRTFTATSRSRT